MHRKFTMKTGVYQFAKYNRFHCHPERSLFHFINFIIDFFSVNPEWDMIVCIIEFLRDYETWLLDMPFLVLFFPSLSFQSRLWEISYMSFFIVKANKIRLDWRIDFRKSKCSRDHPCQTSACLRGRGVSPCADGQKVTVHKDWKSPP